MSVTFPPWQKVVGPEAVMVAIGFPTFTATGADIAEQPFSPVIISV